MIFYIEGPYSHAYLVEAESEPEAIDKCCDYEQTLYDSWAYCGYDSTGEWQEDYFAMDSDFSVITKDEFNTWPFYLDLVGYDFSKCIWGSGYSAELIENKDYDERRDY